MKILITEEELIVDLQDRLIHILITSTVKPHEPINCLLTSAERIVHAQRVFVYKTVFEFGGFCNC